MLIKEHDDNNLLCVFCGKKARFTFDSYGVCKDCFNAIRAYKPVVYEYRLLIQEDENDDFFFTDHLLYKR